MSKRKRSAKTTPNQYGEYLKAMEEDSIFRSGATNPTVGPNYFNNKWEILTQKLNSHEAGPELTAAEWKKRFNDWKNATRAKYRKLVELSKQTEGGSATELTLTRFEERGLRVWGKVALTGTPKVDIFRGLQNQHSVENLEIVVQKNPDVNVDFMKTEDIYSNPSSCEPFLEAITIEQPELSPVLNSEPGDSVSDPSCMTSNVQSLPVIRGEFLNLCKENPDTENANMMLEKKKLNLDYNKFKFEVAKYKFENPGFEFEMEEFCG